MKDRIDRSGGLESRFVSSMNILKFSLALPLLALAMTLTAWSQAPGLAWTNNAGAALFALDTSGNAYASSNGFVKIINPSGQTVQSNQICNLPGIAQRDSSGNYYFSGSFVGTKNDYLGMDVDVKVAVT